MSILRKCFASFTLVSALILGGTAQAQVTQLPGTGCPGMPKITVTGDARLNTKISCACPPSIDRMRVLLGLPSVRVKFDKPFMCVSNCSLDMLMLVMVNSPGFTATVPNTPSTIGTRVIAQCLQTSLNRTCVLLTPAVELKVQR